MKTTIIYLVTWCLSYMVPTSCPDRPKEDEFGRTTGMMVSCSVQHLRQEKECEHSRHFASIDSAYAFIKRSKINNSDTWFPNVYEYKVVDIKLDSLVMLKDE